MNSKEKQPIIVSDKGNSRHTFRNRRTVLILLIGVCLAIASLLYAVEIMSGTPKNLETNEERDKMTLSKTGSAANHVIPTVDAYVPARIETATFALG